MMLAAASMNLGTVSVSVREEVNTNYASYSKCQKICACFGWFPSATPAVGPKPNEGARFRASRTMKYTTQTAQARFGHSRLAEEPKGPGRFTFPQCHG